jgi:hypothetical protein
MGAYESYTMNQTVKRKIVQASGLVKQRLE